MARKSENRLSLDLDLKSKALLDELSIILSPTKADVFRSAMLHLKTLSGSIDSHIFVDSRLPEHLQLKFIQRELQHALDPTPPVVTSLDDVIKALITPPSGSPSISLSSIIIPEKKVHSGLLVVAHTMVWSAVCRHLSEDWSRAYEISSDKWEEIIAGAFDMAGYEEVTLTPRSGDHGRDVIAVRRGVGCIKIIGSVKAYKPDLNVSYDAVRALIGVMTGEQDTSKGIIATTSDFPPRIRDDPFISRFLPTRLELINGVALKAWLQELADAGRK